MPQNTRSSARGVVYKSTEPRLFKACRTCRLQKARCLGAEDPPCKRCRATGRNCVFEEIQRNPRKRGEPSHIDEPINTKRTRQSVLDKATSEVGDASDSMPATPHQSSQHQHIRARPRSSQHPPKIDTTQVESNQNEVISSELTLSHLNAPIEVVYSMTEKGAPLSPSSMPSQNTTSLSLNSPPKSLKNHVQNASRCLEHDDIISAGVLSEAEGRKLFQLYMANANIFIPLFDPAADTFDVVRRRSKFCFTVILAISMRVEHVNSDPSRGDLCLKEARSLAVESLFASSASLETIQGMILLAAYTVKNWFAVNHAYQMGQDMGLVSTIPRDTTPSNSNAAMISQSDRRQIRKMRTALVLHQIEQEVASGTNRQPRSLTVHDQFLKSFLRNQYFNSFDMRIVANVEVVQLRAQILEHVKKQNGLIGSVMNVVERLEASVDEWFNHWDTILEDQDLSIRCFQRSSIRLQRDYTFIIVCSMIISKLYRELAATGTSDLMTEEMSQVVEVAFQRSKTILCCIADDNDYKWQLQWAPTYSALFPTFTAALAFKLVKLRTSLADWGSLYSMFSRVANILENYPHRQFASIIQSLAEIAQGHSNEQTPSQSHGTRQLNRANGMESLDLAGNAEKERNPIQVEDFELDSRHHGYRQEIASPKPPSARAANFEGRHDAENSLCWSSIPLSDFSAQDSLFQIEQLDFNSSLAVPDFLFDFDSFAASIQTSRELLDD